MTIGIYASVIGAIGIISGVYAGSLATMIIGQAIAGVGFGASFTAALRLIFPLAATHQRAGVVGGIYLVSYLAFGVPIVIEGELTRPLGEIPAVSLYTGIAIILALISLIAQLRLKRNLRSAAGPACTSLMRASGATKPARDDTPA
ncbi:PucC family protein [Kribbella rubisoli]|uniref:PucC family protein n=1 Tax=Kribbella rubisoli TaxID=3075929 RepID=UPI001F543F43|nr:PucC family protein [Kribbella rubisoli]